MGLKSLLERLPGARRNVGRVSARHVPADASAQDLSSAAPRERFIEWAESRGPSTMVMEVGTRQAAEGRSTHLQDAFPEVPRENYVMVDVEPGFDVDVVADLHTLPDQWTARFDVVIAGAVFEHLERPWIAAKEVFRVLKPGGRCFIATHQTFPLHGHPSDFFRFSKEALSLIFADAGIQTLDVAYEHRTQIITPEAVMSSASSKSWNELWPSYLIVHLFGEKPGDQEQCVRRPGF